MTRFHLTRAAVRGATLAVAVIGAFAFVLSTGSIPVHATQTQLCAQYGSGYCLNDWNGGGQGNPVKMYTGNVSHENFSVQPANVCNGNNIVTSTCPFTIGNFNSYYQNSRIFYVKYNPNGLCVGTSGSDGNGYLEPCSVGHGAWFVGVGGGYGFVNVSWTDQSGYAAYLCSGGVSGGPVKLDQVTNITQSCYWAN